MDDKQSTFIYGVKWLYTIITLTAGLMSPYLFVTWEYYYLLTPLSFLISLFDFIISDRPWKNIAIMKLNGFTSTYIWGTVFFNVISFQSIFYYLKLSAPEERIIIPRFDTSLIVGVIIILLLGDYLFYVAHKILHETEYGTKIHLLHHCCIWTSNSTNIFFHPLDLFIEFFGPFILNYICFRISDDFFLYVVVTSIMQTWYTGTHDEMISNHHRDHHLYINSNYPIYLSWNSPNPKDKLKHLIKY